jgi:ferredoxin
MAIKIDPEKCPQNHVCPLIKTCPMQAISQIDNGLPAIDPELCVECGICVEKCRMKAVFFEE